MAVRILSWLSNCNLRLELRPVSLGHLRIHGAIVIFGSHLQTVTATGSMREPDSIVGRCTTGPLPPFHSWGLVFGIRGVENDRAAAEVGRTNLPSDTVVWAADGLPWGSASESAYALARLVVRFLRPDWRASFWSREYFEEVARDFAHRFLVPAPRSGGQVTRPQINAWFESLGLAAPPLSASVRLVSSKI
ncbi:hypothetical protein PTE31013_03805 [Pandoraea terrigena]|uniref:Uncharacterized protein n=1 Tax=Pandoraea terrigena TaxID=2508292 RepID=A0A5E4XBI7_9BURK|nr:hypothetical protein PTE31013_03805 [Pandoraea terrigena]